MDDGSTTRKAPSGRVASSARSPRRRGGTRAAFTLGRAAMERISAVEGLALTDEAVRLFEQFERDGTPDEECRRTLAARFGRVGG